MQTQVSKVKKKKKRKPEKNEYLQNLPNRKTQRHLLSPDKSVRSQKPNKSIRSQKYKHYNIKPHVYGRDHTHTHRHTKFSA